MQFRTRAIHIGQEPDPATGAVVTPIHLATTFRQPAAGEWGEFDYSRSANPTRKRLETAVANLEGAVDAGGVGGGAMAFATGMAATHCALGLLAPGDHLVAGCDIYGGTYRLLQKVLRPAGVGVSMVNTCDLEAVEAAITPATKMLWVESPGNPLLSITDYAAVAELAHRHGALAACDNTFATPVLTRPLELGADIVMHSATKYYGGHSDIMAGLLATADKALYERLYFRQNATGGTLGPLESFLMLRGIKTLALRVREQSATAQRLAEWLAGRPEVSRVLYPGLPTHPGHKIAARQMQGGFGAMMSFELAAGFDAAKRAVQSTRLFHLAVSLGAVESLIEQPASMSHASYDAGDRLKHGISDGLIRISVGLEDYEDLRTDLERALAASHA